MMLETWFVTYMNLIYLFLWTMGLTTLCVLLYHLEFISYLGKTSWAALTKRFRR